MYTPEQPQSSYEELAALVVEQREVIATQQRRIAELEVSRCQLAARSGDCVGRV